MDINNINENQRWMQDRLPGFPEPPGPLEHYDDSHPVVQENMGVRRGIIEGTDRQHQGGWSPLDSTLVDLLARSNAPKEHLRNLRGHGVWQGTDNGEGTLATFNPTGAARGIKTYYRNREDSEKDWVNGTGFTNNGKTALVTHELGHLQQFINREGDLLKSSPDAQSPYIEGHAEGYAQHYTPHQPITDPLLGDYIKKYDGTYSPIQFEHLAHGPELFMEAKNHARETGDPGSLNTVDNVYQLSNVLTGERDDGRVTDRERTDATHRMLINHLQKQRGIPSQLAAHEDEFQQRNIAVHGQTVQGSMFPDIVPETNQFGAAPFLGPAEVNQSRVGRNWARRYKENAEKSFERLRNMED
jgi:hypothetical protein